MYETEKENRHKGEKNKVDNGKTNESDELPYTFENHANKFKYLFHRIPTVVNHQRLSELG